MFSKKKDMDNGMKKERKKYERAIPQSITDSIPYVAVYENGVIEVEPGLFSVSYGIPPVNFKTANDNEQWRLAELYSEFMNSFDSNVTIQITLYNRTIDMDTFRDEVYVKVQADNLNDYREEYNQMLEQKMLGAKNNLETMKILTVTVEAIDIDAANDQLSQIDSMIQENMTTMTKKSPEQLTLIERLDILNQIYNQKEARPVYEKRMIEGHESESFTLENCDAQGITTKELIAPEALEFLPNEGKTGNTIFKSFYVSAYPTYIRGTILTDFSQLPTNMLTSVFFHPVEQSQGLKMIKEKSVNIKSEVINAEKGAAKNNIYGDIAVPTSLKDANSEVDSLFGKMTRDNIKIYMVTFLFTLFADSEEEMKGYEDQLKLIGNKNLITIKSLHFQQEAGFNSCLPIGRNDVQIQRLMTTQSVASIIPFDVKEVRQKKGMYYGQNAVSHNMILYNRLSNLNPNSCILGMPGSGKSFAAKREMINVLLNTDDEIYVIDPEREYKPLVDAFGGTCVKISNGSDVYINPFDMDIENSDDAGDPVKVKSDFIESLCEIMIGGNFGLTSIEQSIIGRSVINIYEPYLELLKRKGLTTDPSHAPTLNEFYNDLYNQPQLEAQNLALALERYVKGSLDIFSHRTNVNVNNRFVVYDIKDIGAGLKELGLQIALDTIWNKMIENHRKGKRTWFYIDEFYLMMQKPSSADYISQIWKRARKWNGLPCAITQNVEDMLKSEQARTVINNCSFIIILGQSPINKQQLSSMLNISPAEQKYIATAKPGRGLLRIGEDLIPMDDSFPKDTKLYEIMTTNPNEKKVS